MTEDIEDIIASVNINNVLTAILQEHGKLSVPVLSFLDSNKVTKQLIIDYDEDTSSFVFSLGDNVE